MRPEKRQDRMRQIEAVAYEMLGEVGYEGTSMLAVAKRARASNETMYRWYGDKNGLFASMIAANAAKVSDALEGLRDEGASPLETLHRIAPVLLGMLLSDTAVALNKAAAADASGALGQVLMREGRARVFPLLRDVMQAAVRDGSLVPPAEGTLGELFMHLLVGDQQIRRVIGMLEAPTEAEIDARARVAMVQFTALCSGARRT